MLKYLVAVTEHLASLSILLGLIFSFLSTQSFSNFLFVRAGQRGWSFSPRKFLLAGLTGGVICALVVFFLRLLDPRGMNIPLIRFNRWLIAIIALTAFLSFLLALIDILLTRRKEHNGGLLQTSPEPAASPLSGVVVAVLSLLCLLTLSYLIPPILQFTREFVYFGESGVSTNAVLRALGFFIGLFVCFFLALSARQVHKSLGRRAQTIFLLLSLSVFTLEYGVAAVAALQRQGVFSLSPLVFQIMIFGDVNPNFFLFAQIILMLIMLVQVIALHRYPLGSYHNPALLRKEKARLRNCRRWAWTLFSFCAAVSLIAVVLRWYDTLPPVEARPEEYVLKDGIILIPLTQVDDGHLHKFSYKTPNGFDVRFLAVKKPAGSSYGLGLDACEICGVAGYYERGEDEVVCRRCDVVMNKNTIGFRGGCNPIPFAYEIKEGIIRIDVRELIRHERRFR